MTGVLFDLAMLAGLLGLAGTCILARPDVSAILAFLATGLLLALAWTRLGATDVALTEAAVGGGLTGLLLLRGLGGLPTAPAPAPPSAARRLSAAVACGIVTAGVACALLLLPDPAPSLADAAVRSLPRLGLGNPVTAVLISYRGFDTLLEKMVLLLALIGVWSLATDRAWGAAPTMPRSTDPALGPLLRVLLPVGVLLGIYLVWTSADAPGGTFPGSAVLAAVGLLAAIGGQVRLPAIGRRRMRLVLIAGPSVFFAVGLAGFALADGFLSYPAWAPKAFILLIEIALTPSLALGLMLLLAGPPRTPGS